MLPNSTKIYRFRSLQLAPAYYFSFLIALYLVFVTPRTRERAIRHGSLGATDRNSAGSESWKDSTCRMEQGAIWG
jgi:hypothetical protein